jgi:hypothetical protein
MRPVHELVCEVVSGIERYSCNKDIDKECEGSRARTFEWYDGWRRSRGLEPHDGQRGAPPVHVYEVFDGVESWYHLWEDIYLVIIETQDGKIVLNHGERKIF